MADNRSPTQQEMVSFQFINMVLQISNMAMMFLGKLAHPETGKATVELQGARMFIDQLEMLHVKTRGNLNSDEQKVLTDSLTSLRMMFVETASAENKKPASKPAEQATLPASDEPVKEAANAMETPVVDAPTADAASGDSDAKKKFVKKY